MIGYIILPIVGFLIGLLMISFGGGGGSLYVGILTAFLGVSPAIAVTTSLATAIPTTAVGAYSHWKAGNVNVKLGVQMLISGAIAAIVGSMISGLLPEQIYTVLTGVILIALSVRMTYSFIKRHKRGDKKRTGLVTRKDTVKAVFYGVVGGLMSGVVGLSGGGAITAGLMALGCSSLETVGTSVLVILGTAIVAFGMHLSMGSVDWMLVALLASGTVVGAFAAPRLLARADKEKLEVVLNPAMIVLCVVMGVILLLK